MDPDRFNTNSIGSLFPTPHTCCNPRVVELTQFDLLLSGSGVRSDGLCLDNFLLREILEERFPLRFAPKHFVLWQGVPITFWLWSHFILRASIER